MNHITASPARACRHCGNNPVNHRLMWFNETAAVIMSPLIGSVMGSRWLKPLARILTRLLDPLWRIAERCGWIRSEETRPADLNHRAEVLWDEAERRGFTFERISMFGRDLDQYRVTVANKQIIFSGLPRPEYMPGTGEWWVDDKAAVKAVLRRAGVPVAAGGVFSRLKPALQKFRQLEKPVIIKPRLGSRGRHTTTFIYTEEQLTEAFSIAKQLCHWVIMEEHLVGSVYRGTMIDGKLIGVLGGCPPRITGDGVHTIFELIELKNQTRHSLVSPVVPTDHMGTFLERIGYSFESILAAGVTIDLTEKIGVSYGGNSFEVTNDTNPETKRVLEAAAAAIGDPIIGFDFIITDIAASPHGQKWGIIECNGLPFINLHHDPVEGRPVNAAAAVWDFVEKNIQYY